MAQDSVQFYRYSQEAALAVFLPLLEPHFPISNGTYNRIRSPVNLPSRHCLFAATFPPDTAYIPNDYTVLFADRSRHDESQIWMFNPLNNSPVPLSHPQKELLNTHVLASILFLKDISIPEAPGWPFKSILKFSCIHQNLANEFVAIGEAKDAIPRHTEWNLWVIQTQSIDSISTRPLPDNYSIGRVPASQIDIVISTSSIPRQASTYLQLPSVGVLNPEGLLVAWGFTGPDGSFATLFVLPKYRGLGLAKIVTVKLLGYLHAGEYKDLGFNRSTGWAHSNVYKGNEASEAVMKSVNGRCVAKTSYIWIDSEKF